MRVVPPGWRLLPVGLAAVIGAMSSAAAAQETAAARTPRVQSPQKPRQGPSAEQTLYLVRTTLLTLDDANRSGNYSVLRDTASPAFQQANSAADLAVAFQHLRRGGLDLGAAALAEPRLSVAPAVDESASLRLAGTLPSGGRLVEFDLRFTPAAGHWRLLALSLGLRAERNHAPAPPPSTRKPAQGGKGH